MNNLFMLAKYSSTGDVYVIWYAQQLWQKEQAETGAHPMTYNHITILLCYFVSFYVIR